MERGRGIRAVVMAGLGVPVAISIVGRATNRACGEPCDAGGTAWNATWTDITWATGSE